MNDKISIYVHIPFCKSKCYYCDFCSFANKDDVIEKYIDAVCKEILNYGEILSSRNIETIYIGGGTPSYIDSKYIVKILNLLSMFNTTSLKEVTIEVNPNSLTEEKVKDYVHAGVNRFSIGLQSIYDDVLNVIGRKHKYDEYLKCLEILKENNITNISTDLIYPLPNLNFKRFKEEVDEIILLSKKYPLKHISVYNLELHEGTKLEFLIKENYLTLPGEEEEYNMKEYLELALDKNGFSKYEISNYAKEGFESKHNLTYWKQGEYLGAGLNASSFISGIRYSNTSNIDDYISYYIGSKTNVLSRIKQEEMDMLSLMKEYIILNLRLKEGINVISFRNRFKTDIFDLFKNELNNLNQKGLINITKSNISLTKRGFEVANLAFEEFI